MAEETAAILTDKAEAAAEESADGGKADNSGEKENGEEKDSLSDNGADKSAEFGAEEKAAEEFRKAVVRLKREKAARTDAVIGLAAKIYGADKNDYDGIEAALYERLISDGRKNDMGYRLGRWKKESEAVKEQYPDFDLNEELSDRRFFSLCYKGVSLADAYLITHKDEIIMAAMEYAAAELRRNGVGRSAADRVREGALSAGNSVSSTPKRLSKSERRELIRRTERGERIIL